MGEAKRRKVMAKTIPRAASMVSDAGLIRPCGVSDGSAGWLNCFNTSREYVREHGGEVVFGFIVDGGRSSGPAVTFNHHAIIRVADEFIDPNYKPNRAPLFLPDALRPYDYEGQINWNNIVVFAAPFRCPITKTLIPAWTLATTARINEQSAYSLDRRHFRRKHFEEGDDYQSYVRGLGLNPTNDVDLCFTTNIERVYVVLGADESAPASIKDFHYEGAGHDVTKLTQRGLVPLRIGEVRSETENEQFGRKKRDG